MASFVFDLNDIELRLLRDGATTAESTGFAFIQGANVEFGEAARRRARLHPRQASSQYWHRLALDPLQIRGPNLANLADLVYRQMRELTTHAGMTKSDSLLIAAPGTVTPDQLGLLLGVAQEIGITVNGLVDAAVAAATQSDRSGRVTHIDVSLHRATVTSLELGDAVARLAVAEVPDAGLSHVIDGWVNVVANRFVAETRFDPLRIAETEQQVYNQVQDWVVSNDLTSELIVEANHRDALRRVTVPTALMIDKAIARLRALSDAIPAHSTVLLSHRAVAVPGLADRIRADHATIDTLPRDALARGVEANVDAIRSNPEALKFVTRLTRDVPSIVVTKPAARPPPEPASRDGATAIPSEPRWPTHVLHRGRARAIGTRLNVGRAAFPETTRADALPERVALVEHAADGVWARPGEPGLALNGKPLKEAAKLRIGDALRLGDHEFVLIRVLDGEAP
jgi:hypothetical protein